MAILFATLTSFMISVLLPTYNEAESLPLIVPRIVSALQGYEIEILVLDDNSPDGTADVARKLQGDAPMLRTMIRTGERGLSPAVMDGFAEAKGERIVVMDSDGQHDPALLPELVAALEQGSDVAIASRYVAGGSTGSWNMTRLFMSRVASALAMLALLRSVRDPLSGYFAVRRETVRVAMPRMHASGFKILFELLSVLPKSIAVCEVPFRFGLRQRGESKLSGKVQRQFLQQWWRLFFPRAGWIAATIFFLVAALLIGSRLSAQLPLYTSTDLRNQVQASITRTASEEGWLLSGVSIQEVHNDGVYVQYRDAVRGSDSIECHWIPFDASPFVPCEQF